jgi:mono/diheme cytochrome c family protein
MPAALSLATLAAACGGSSGGGDAPTTPATATESAPLATDTPASDTPSPPDAPVATGVDDPAQPERGAKLYAEYCSDCHGDRGEGKKKAPAVVGAGALPLDPPAGKKRDVPFRTAADVLAWTKKTMPADDPGSLTDDQYADVVAFALKENGVDLAGKRLDANSAANIQLRP